MIVFISGSESAGRTKVAGATLDPVLFQSSQVAVVETLQRNGDRYNFVPKSDMTA
jgi:hypothetical protein